MDGSGVAGALPPPLSSSSTAASASPVASVSNPLTDMSLGNPEVEFSGGETDEPEVCEAQLETDFTFAVTLLLITLLLAVLIARLTTQYKLSWLQSSSTSLAMGILVGGLSRLVNVFAGGGIDSAFDAFVAFDPSFFFIALVPPIIFNAGFTLDSRSFFYHSGAFCTFAFLGTLISTAATSGLLLLVRSIIGVGLTNLHSVLFGSLISATDPVTVLAIFTQLRVEPQLYTLVFGESVMNDAVAIVLYRTVLRFEPNACGSSNAGGGVDAADVLTAGGFFITVFVGSTLIGAVVGVGSALIHKKGWFHDGSETVRVMEASLVLLPPYISYMAAEAAQLSGIVAILFCGIVMNHFTKWNLTDEARSVVSAFFEIIAYIAETFVFIYIGTEFFLSTHRLAEVGFTMLALVAVLLARAVNIYPLSALINLFSRGDDRISLRQQHMLFFSGLRGGIAFALAMQAKQDLGDSPDAQLILDCTLVTVLFTVWVNGGLAPTFLRCLGVSFDLGLGDEAAEYLRGSGGDDDDIELSMVAGTSAASSPRGGSGGVGLPRGTTSRRIPIGRSVGDGEDKDKADGMGSSGSLGGVRRSLSSFGRNILERSERLFIADAGRRKMKRSMSSDTIRSSLLDDENGADELAALAPAHASAPVPDIHDTSSSDPDVSVLVRRPSPPP